MKPWLRLIGTGLVLTCMLLGACATGSKRDAAGQPEAASWRGRLALVVQSDQAQSFSSAFELRGNAQAGELTLLTPLGQTAATLSWSAQAAVWRSNDKVQQFESLDALIKNALGTELPVAALFAWLDGKPMEAAGWSADVSHYAQGRVTAQRQTPGPPAQLRVVLD